MYKDISKCSVIDKNLKTILNTVTYLEWPEDENTRKVEKFWKQLELTLPKKRTSSSTSSSGLEDLSSPSNLTSIISPPCHVDAPHIANVTSYASPIATESDTPVVADGSKEVIHTENRTQRIKQMMKDVLKLKISPNNNSFSRLSREGSVESGVVTPLSATPSPGLNAPKDVTPLIARRKMSHKRSKSLTWSERTLKHILSSDGKNRSLREKECSRHGLDVIPPSPDCVDNERVNLPDICRTDEGTYFNIVCEEEVQNEERIGPRSIENHVDCNTCVVNSASDDSNVTCFHENYCNQENATNPNVCPTCLYNIEVGNENNESINNYNINNSHPLGINMCNTCMFPREVLNSNVQNINSVSDCQCRNCRRRVSNENSPSQIWFTGDCTSVRLDNRRSSQRSSQLSTCLHCNAVTPDNSNNDPCDTCILSRRDSSYDINSNNHLGNQVSRNGSAKNSFRIYAYEQFMNISCEPVTDYKCESKIVNSSNSSEIDNVSIDSENNLGSENFLNNNNVTNDETSAFQNPSISNSSEDDGNQEPQNQPPIAPKRTKKLSRKR